MRIIKIYIEGIFLYLLITNLFSQKFQFAILGDRTGGADQKVFEKIIEEISKNNLDFVINVGDLIEGYIGDENLINARWDTILNTIKKLPCPFYFVPGNNDIWNEKSREIYIKRTNSKTYYSFDYGNVHFIIIDNSIINGWEEIDTLQLNWIKKDLSNTEKEIIFCFFHKPFWINAVREKKTDIIHEILKTKKKVYVISGHLHVFTKTSIDNIKYLVAGSSGGSIGGNEALGEFYGYTLVSVENGNINVKFIKIDGEIVPDNALNFEEREKLLKIQKEYVNIEPIIMIEGKRFKKSEIKVKIKNILEEDFTSTFKWNFDEKIWKISPQEYTYTFKKNKLSTLKFKLINTSYEKIFPLPFFEFVYPRKGWGEYRISNSLKLIRQVNIKKTRMAPKIDGKINENCWKVKIDKLYGNEGKITKVEPTEIYFTYDENNFYIGIKCIQKIGEIKSKVKERDNSEIIGDDCVILYFDVNVFDPFVHQIIVNPEGIIFDQLIEFKEEHTKRNKSWNGDWKVSTGKEKYEWIVEISIPFDMFGKKIEKGTKWRFNIARIEQSAQDIATWQPIISIDPNYFGIILFE
ncbi:MAG: metallophosphoesterase [candidate division WOR-3 bacterium]